MIALTSVSEIVLLSKTYIGVMRMTPDHKTYRKAPSFNKLSAFFIACSLVFGNIAVAQTDSCVPEETLEVATIKRVVDGDTVHLSDGRKVRLIGVNTPEFARNGRRAEPLSKEAKKQLDTLFRETRKVQLQLGRQQKDSYGRLLAHAFLPDGRNVQQILLAAGLAYPITIPPNTAYQDCYHTQSDLAQAEGLGIWAHDYFSERVVAELRPKKDAGFRVVTGRVNKVSESRSSWWIELDGKLSLRLSKKDVGYFPDTFLDELQGRSVSVEGWLIRREKQDHYPRWLMHLKHPSAITVKREVKK